VTYLWNDPHIKAALSIAYPLSSRVF